MQRKTTATTRPFFVCFSSTHYIIDDHYIFRVGTLSIRTQLHGAMQEEGLEEQQTRDAAVSSVGMLARIDPVRSCHALGHLSLPPTL